MSNGTASPAIDERRLTAWIGKSLRIEGRVISAQDLTIEGQVEGTIELGDYALTVGTGAGIKANLVARTITISGAVTGNVTASETVDLRATGSVEGNVAAPRVLMADGAVINGKVDAAGKKGAAKP